MQRSSLAWWHRGGTVEVEACVSRQEVIEWYLMKLFESVELKQKSMLEEFAIRASSLLLVSAFAMRTLSMERPTNSLISMLSLSVRDEVLGNEVDQLWSQRRLVVAISEATAVEATF